MDELVAITERLRKQRQDIEDLMDQTASRSGATADLIGKIEELRRRSEETTLRFRASVGESDPASAK